MALLFRGELIDVEAVLDRNKDHGCTFNAECGSVAWAMKFDVPDLDPIAVAIAQIYVNDYAPLELAHASNSALRFACYVGPHATR